MNATIFDIKRFAVHDGPGIRTTIFFKGCPLFCWWCHNPESRSQICQPYKKKQVLNEKIYIKEEVLGERKSLEELMSEIEKDRVFYDESMGGVTFSGGEPLIQANALKQLAKVCKLKKIHTALDTTGYASEEVFKETTKDIDLFLFDIKHLDDVIHQKYTGVSNKVILKNLNYLYEKGRSVRIRFPLIPNVNTDKDHLSLLENLLTSIKSEHINHIDLLPYHKIGSDKYERFGIKSHNEKFYEPDDKSVQKIKERLEKTGFYVNIGG